MEGSGILVEGPLSSPRDEDQRDSLSTFKFSVYSGKWTSLSQPPEQMAQDQDLRENFWS